MVKIANYFVVLRKRNLTICTIWLGSFCLNALYFIDFNHTCGWLIIANETNGELYNLENEVVVTSSDGLADGLCILDTLGIYSF